MRTEWTIEMYSDWSLSLFVRARTIRCRCRRRAGGGVYGARKWFERVQWWIFRHSATDADVWLNVPRTFFSRFRFAGCSEECGVWLRKRCRKLCTPCAFHIHRFGFGTGGGTTIMPFHVKQNVNGGNSLAKYLREIFILNCIWRRTEDLDASSSQQQVHSTLRFLRIKWSTLGAAVSPAPIQHLKFVILIII